MASRDSTGQALIWDDDFVGKRCADCGQVKPLTEFQKATRGTGYKRRGLKKATWSERCKPCGRERKRISDLRRQAREDSAGGKRCRTCGVVKPTSGFRKGSATCYSCYMEKTREQRRLAKLRLSFGLSPEEFAAMFAAQNGRCAICGEEETAQRKGRTKQIAVDHDHRTGKIRSLLCGRCNKGLGCFHDDVALLRAAVAYLESHA